MVAPCKKESAEENTIANKPMITNGFIDKGTILLTKYSKTLSEDSGHRVIEDDDIVILISAYTIHPIVVIINTFLRVFGESVIKTLWKMLESIISTPKNACKINIEMPLYR